MTAGRWSSWSIQILQFLMLWWPAMKAGSTAMTKRQSSHWKHASSPRSKKARQSKFSHKLLMFPLFLFIYFFWQHWYALHALGFHWTDSQQEYYVEVLREFRKRFRQKRPALLKSGQWHFHQDNASVHNSILVTDYLSKMGIKTVPHPPYCPDLAPCDFWFFPKLKEKLLRLSLWDNWGDERGCDEGHWHAHTRRLLWGPYISCWNYTTSALQPEKITSKGTRVSCVYYQ